jgi:hypothetical protein
MELMFSLMTHASSDQLKECYNLGLRVKVLQTHLKKTDLMGGFNIWCCAGTIITPTDILGNGNINGPTLSLIDNIDQIFEMYVHQMMHFKCYYGQEYDLQDLQWLQELLKNSCDKDL